MDEQSEIVNKRMPSFTIQQRYKYYFSRCIFLYVCVFFFFLVRIYPSVLLSECVFFSCAYIHMRFFPVRFFFLCSFIQYAFFWCAFFLCVFFFQCAFSGAFFPGALFSYVLFSSALFFRSPPISNFNSVFLHFLFFQCGPTAKWHYFDIFQPIFTIRRST